MKILVTDCKYRSSVAALRDLKEAGHEVFALSFGDGIPFVFSSKYIDETFVLPDLEGKERAERTAELAERIGVDVIFPIGRETTRVFARYLPGKAFVPSAEMLDLADDKAAIAKTANSLGIPTPKTYDNVSDVTEFPVVVKYRNGEMLKLKAKDRYAIAHDRIELEREYGRMSGFALSHGADAPIIQKYIAGDGYGVSAVCVNGTIVSAICHKRLREYPISGGPSALCESVWNETLFEYAERLFEELGWNGIIMAEFKGTPESGFALLETNPRVWGSFALTRAAGSGFSQAYVEAASGTLRDKYTEPKYDLGVRMGFAYSNLAAAAAYLRCGRIADAFGAFRDAFSKKIVDGVFEKGDPSVKKAYRHYLLKKVTRK